MTNKPDTEQPKLTRQQHIDNVMYSFGWIWCVVEYVLLWASDARSRRNRHRRWRMPLPPAAVTIDAANTVPAEAEMLVWRFGIPTASGPTFWNVVGDEVVLSMTIYVPRRQAWMADAQLRAHDWRVMSAPLTNAGGLSSAKAGKWKPSGRIPRQRTPSGQMMRAMSRWFGRL